MKGDRLSVNFSIRMNSANNKSYSQTLKLDCVWKFDMPQEIRDKRSAEMNTLNCFILRAISGSNLMFDLIVINFC